MAFGDRCFEPVRQGFGFYEQEPAAEQGVFPGGFFRFEHLTYGGGSILTGRGRFPQLLEVGPGAVQGSALRVDARASSLA